MLIRKTNEIIAEVLAYPINDLNPEQHLCYDLLADSLALMDLMINLEESFGFKMEQGQFDNIHYVKDIYQLVTRFGHYPLGPDTNNSDSGCISKQ
ncbi:acyl carrier protein [Kalamiella sp. sgz302252]|uniref:acyl carrier protein n=1 Tax=Pantoea sp. sgz302252 TaxID=3341827 RepID=UPI0036D2EFD1